MRISTVLLAIFTALLSAVAYSEPIERIRPSDGIASIRINASVRETQIDVTFSEDMIPLGGGHGSFPVKLQGRGACNWGWRGPRTLSCLLGQEDHLPLAESYALVIEDGLTTISGDSVPPFRLEFETDKPTVNFSNIDWDEPTVPVIYVRTNVPVSTRELQRRIILEPLGQPGSSVRVAASPDPEPARHLSEELQFAIRPTSALSADTPYVVQVRDGLAGVDSGLVGSAHDAGAFRTHSEFEFIGIGCGPHADRSYWEHQHPIVIPANPDCAPEQHVALLFSAEPETRGLYDALTDAGLAPQIASTLEVRHLLYQPASMAHYQASKVIYAVRLSGFPAGASNNVILPAAIKDRFSRPLDPTTAIFPTRNFVPAFLNHLTLGVIASGSGDAVEFATVNSDAISVRLHRDDTPGILSLTLATESRGVNERGTATLNIEEELGKSSGVLVGEAAITHRALVNKRELRGFPIQYAQSVGAILTPWDVIVAAKGLGLRQQHSVWVSSLESGEAVSGATVELLERPGSGRDRDTFLATAYRAGNVLGTARTDDGGFAEIFPTTNAPTNTYPSFVRVTKGDIVVVLPIEAYQFAHNVDQPRDYRSNYSPHGGYLGEAVIITWGITDKPLYRSGETVQIKGFARVRDDNRLVIPGDREGWTLSCAAYPNDLCTGRTVDLDEYGAFEATLDLPSSVLDGEYRISVHRSAQSGLPALSFHVANYKPKPHQVQVEIAGDSIVGDDPIRLSASAEYFAGGVLRNADAQVIIETGSDSPPVPERLLEDYYFGPTRWYHRGQSVHSVSGAEFDERGRLSGSFPLPPNSPASGVATITVGALHDGGEWAYSDRKTVKYVQKPFLLGLQQKEEFIAAGEVYNAGVILIDLQGAGADGLSVIQTLEYASNRFGGKTRPVPDVAGECTVRIRVNDPASCELMPTRIGSAVIKARLMRGSEEVLHVGRRVTVTASGQRPWSRRKSDRLEFELQAEEFQVNQVVEIVVDVPYEKATVLFSLHRNSVFEQWREVLPRGKNKISIPLTEKHTPGFTVTAIARPVGADAGTSIGSAFVRVQSAQEIPTLAIDTDREGYKTGEQVKLTVTSTASGKTQLTVAVIDEAVLDLVPNVDDLFDPQGKRLAGLLEGWSNFRWWQLSRAIDAGEGSATDPEEISVSANRRVYDGNSAALAMSMAPADGAPGSGDIPLRSMFVEAAYFNPNIVTSDNGDAEIYFAVPDNLGKWRAVVIGADTGGQLFANSRTFNVALPLEVRGDLPARLISGDSIQLSATVLNRKSHTSDVSLSVQVDAGNGEVKSETQTSAMDSMASFSVSAAVGPVAGNQVQLTAFAKDSEDADSLIISTPVHNPMESRSWTSTAPLLANGKFVQPIELPVNAQEASAELRLTLDKSVIGYQSQTFHYMSQSGHRTWEQILSRAVVAAYANSWDQGEPYRVTRQELLNQLTQGSNFQSASGGMSHFEPREDRANDYLSAYTVLALHWVEELGFDIPSFRHGLLRYLHERANRGLRGRRYAYRTMDIPSTRDMPIMLAALSSSPDGVGHITDQYSQYLRSNVDEFDVIGLAYALITATNIDASSDLRSDLSDRLQARLVETFDRTEISGGDYRFGNRNELYCVVLNALQGAREYAPEPRALAKLVRGGYEYRDQNSGFGNTHANAVCIAALTEYRDAFEAPNERISARVTARHLDPISLSVDTDENTHSSDGVRLPLAERRSELSVSLTHGTTGYASTNVRYDVDLSKEIERSHGYTIKRSYFVYRRKDWHLLGAGSHVKQGEWVRVELDVVSPVVRRFVAVTDPTPAGLEPVDPSVSSAVPRVAADQVRWWNVFNRQALSNVQSRFYAEWLSAGSHKVTYHARAKFAGKFMALPAKVESMYSDGVFATTPPTEIWVKSVDD